MRVEVAGLSRRFGDVQALDDVSFVLPPGRRVALVGPNGSGKSTLNRILAGLLNYEGSVLLDGASPQQRSPERARRVAYLPQVAPQLGAPVRELVRAVTTLRDVSPDAVAARASELGLDLAALAATPLRGLSGGMRQKLMLALTLAAPVSLLVLDEPTSSLDPTTRRRFHDSFDALAGDATVMLCSHRLEEVRALVDHVIALEEGRIVLDGTTAEFLTERASSVIEVRIESEEAGRFLSGLGFRAGPGGWWSRTTDGAGKSALVRRILHELGDALCDLEVRASEGLDARATPSTSEAQARVVSLTSKRRA